MLLIENKSSDFKTLFTKFQDSSNDEPFGKTDAIVVTMGTDEDLVYSKTSALQVSLKFNFFLSSVRGFQPMGHGPNVGHRTVYTGPQTLTTKQH